MNERAKKIFMYLGSFFVGIFTFICGAILHNKRNTANENRARVEELKRESDEQQRDNREAISGIDEALETITEIRKNQKVDDRNIDSFNYCECGFDNNDGPDAT